MASRTFGGNKFEEREERGFGSKKSNVLKWLFPGIKIEKKEIRILLEGF